MLDIIKHLRKRTQTSSKPPILPTDYLYPTKIKHLCMRREALRAVHDIPDRASPALPSSSSRLVTVRQRHSLTSSYRALASFVGAGFATSADTVRAGLVASST